ncbi:hypothetical protein K1T35_47740 (plasmid) [Pseudonocardia sp. DSM 110487]|uniref:hypothetical protein n=1 Tax=Pseudonocardia sp. DSM 110487 TaxID=2865833 RepID=UPI001C6A7C68|nr:hypothetical protein [Pseudonocardia sp. DSM 110487]QYN41044.1 hypothetical protein K1T35_47740 [Pseudonocardia sp. DSM 110487]
MYARDRAAAELAAVNPDLTAVVAAKRWRCVCGLDVTPGEVMAVLGRPPKRPRGRMHIDCAKAIVPLLPWPNDTDRPADPTPIDLDALTE